MRTAFSLWARWLATEPDRVAPERWARDVKDHLGDARLAVLPGVADIIVYSAPDRLGALVDDFEHSLTGYESPSS